MFIFTSTTVSPPAMLFMGRDKYENEDMIRWGWPEDVWFHVDKVSSAHVYLRLQPGQSLENVPADLIEECAQLVKANSIQGCKMNNIKVVYTPWANLKKTAEMEVGQVGFFSEKAVKLISVERKIPEIIKRLDKTKEEKEVDFRAEREARDRRESEAKKKLLREEQERQKEERKQHEDAARLKSYADVFEHADTATNKDGGNDSDDFM